RRTKTTLSALRITRRHLAAGKRRADSAFLSADRRPTGVRRTRTTLSALRVTRRHLAPGKGRADSAFLSADWRPTVAVPGGHRCPPYPFTPELACEAGAKTVSAFPHPRRRRAASRSRFSVPLQPKQPSVM